MSDPRRTDAGSSARDNATLGQTALRQLALKVLAQYSQSADDAEKVAVAARRAYDDLAHVSTSLIGQVGVDALTARAMHLAQREYPWLVDVPASAPADQPFAQVIAGLGRQNPATAAEGVAAVFATFATLLVTFIGESLTMGLLRKAWPGGFSDAGTEET